MKRWSDKVKATIGAGLMVYLPLVIISDLWFHLASPFLYIMFAFGCFIGICMILAEDELPPGDKNETGKN